MGGNHGLAVKENEWLVAVFVPDCSFVPLFIVPWNKYVHSMLHLLQLHSSVMHVGKIKGVSAGSFICVVVVKLKVTVENSLLGLSSAGNYCIGCVCISGTDS